MQNKQQQHQHQDGEKYQLFIAPVRKTMLCKMECYIFTKKITTKSINHTYKLRFIQYMESILNLCIYEMYLTSKCLVSLTLPAAVPSQMHPELQLEGGVFYFLKLEIELGKVNFFSAQYHLIQGSKLKFSLSFPPHYG